MLRREFIRTGLIGLGSLNFPQFVFSKMQDSMDNPKFFILIHLDGGWDISLATDPWQEIDLPNPEDYFIEYKRDELLRLPSGDLVGPALEPLRDYFNHLAIINGVFMSPTDNGHLALRNYSDSGNGQGNYPNVTVNFYKKVPAPYGIITSSHVYMAEDSAPTLAPTEISSNPNLDIEAITGAFSSFEQRSPLLDSYDTIENENQKLIEARNTYTRLKDKGDFVSDHLAIACSFSSGACNQAFINMNPENGNLDTHDNHEGEHRRALTSCFEQIKSLIVALKNVQYKYTGNSIFDYTTLAITSEFCRTPALNNAQGKDHNPFTNSYIVLGPGINGGLKLGGSHIVPKSSSLIGESYHAALPIDMDSGYVYQSHEGNILKPESVMKSLWASMGVQNQLWPKHDILKPLLKS